MGLVGLPNLYCGFGDLADYLSSEGVELRLDDHSLATGQTVQASGTANQGTTSLSVSPLQYALPSGAVLNFDGAGMPSQVQLVLTAAAGVGSTSLTTLPLPAAVNSAAQAIDNGINIATNARVAKAISYATSRVKLYCCSRYDDSALATAWSVNRWAMVLAAQWICKRRGQGVPDGIADDVEETMEELKAVKARALDIEDIATRTSSWPSWSNVSIDLTYEINRARVEQSSSEPTPTQYHQFQDWWDASGGGWDW